MLINKIPRHEDVRGSEGINPSFLTSARDGSKWSASHSDYIFPGDRVPGLHRMKKGGRQGRSERCGKQNSGP
jgi:hypothetical protein